LGQPAGPRRSGPARNLGRLFRRPFWPRVVSQDRPVDETLVRNRTPARTRSRARSRNKPACGALDPIEIDPVLDRDPLGARNAREAYGSPKTWPRRLTSARSARTPSTRERYAARKVSLSRPGPRGIPGERSRRSRPYRSEAERGPVTHLVVSAAVGRRARKQAAAIGAREIRGHASTRSRPLCPPRGRRPRGPGSGTGRSARDARRRG